MLSFLSLLLGVEVHFVHGDGRDARSKGSAVDGGGGAEVALDGKGILILTGNVVLRSHGFCSQPHAPIPFGMVFGHPCVGDGAPTTKGNGGHGFDATSHDAVGHAGVDFGRGNGDGFQTTGAITVDRHAGNLLGVESHQRHHPSDVEALFSFRCGVANNDVVDAGFVQLGKIRHQPTDDLFSQIVGPQKTESPAGSFGHGRAVASYDVCIHQFRRILPF